VALAPAASTLAPLLARSRPTLVHVGLDPALSAARYRARFEAASGTRRTRTGRSPPPWTARYDHRVYLPPADLPCPVVAVDGSLPADVLLAATLAAL
jgi:hypothetical protein